jgi:hypothetical protein
MWIRNGNTVINLDLVIKVKLEDKRVILFFDNSQSYYDFENEKNAKYWFAEIIDKLNKA